MASCRGQGSVEFCVVVAAFIGFAVAGSMLWHAFSDGALASHALAAAARDVVDGGLGAVADVFMT